MPLNQSFTNATGMLRASRARTVRLTTTLSRRWTSSETEPPKPTLAGVTTPHPEDQTSQASKQPFFFDTGYALFAKRPSRPFPPPFLSPPSGSFSDPLSTHNRSRDRRSYYNGELIRGITNGDDAVVVESNFIGANDGVGAWAARPRGHAALWSRLVLHFWALESATALDSAEAPDPIAHLNAAFESTKAATSKPNEWFGTTTACAALLHCDFPLRSKEASPVLYASNIGDSQLMVVRPSTESIIYKTTEQWHWFDCPRQLGTNSPDTPTANAVCDTVTLHESDIVIAATDGLVDNLWEHEILRSVLKNVRALENESEWRTDEKRAVERGSGMMWVAEELVREARTVAEDPFAESPYMERAVEEGIGFEGGKIPKVLEEIRDMSLLELIINREAR